MAYCQCPHVQAQRESHNWKMWGTETLACSRHLPFKRPAILASRASICSQVNSSSVLGVVRAADWPYSSCYGWHMSQPSSRGNNNDLRLAVGLAPQSLPLHRQLACDKGCASLHCLTFTHGCQYGVRHLPTFKPMQKGLDALWCSIWVSSSQVSGVRKETTVGSGGWST